ncbi:uncharacterized protein B0303.4-like [Uranotaenia lowii]|uniref:uncharacterized protein B0303.4-like n=1 Tax=Uranotaenia lowii TaxID=190385 RepID=UPI0024787103|nr:uncharacterized protein B0303.4-like [Uranotaenia lowii]
MKMESKLVILVGMLVAMGLCVSGFTIREKTLKEDFTPYLQTLDAYRQRLQNQGLYPKTDNQNQDVSASSNGLSFDELEVIRLIPVTIKQLRQGLLSSEERLALEKIFGNLWEMISDDANRRKFEPRNSLLETLLGSQEVRLGKQDIRKQLSNDLDGNSIQKVFKPEDTRSIQVTDDTTVEPSQRIIRMVAAIIRKRYRESLQPHKRTSSSHRAKRSSHINLQNVKVTIHVPRAKRSIFPAISMHGLTAEEKRRVEEANEAAIMAAVMAQIGNGLDEDEDEEDDDDDNENAVGNDAEDDEDYYEDDDDDEEQDYPAQLVKNLQSTKQKAENSIDGQDEDGSPEAAKNVHDVLNQAAKQMMSMDYAYDESGWNDDYFLNDYKPRFKPGQFENPSINELIMLAAKHQSIARSNEQRLKKHHFRTASSEEYQE